MLDERVTANGPSLASIRGSLLRTHLSPSPCSTSRPSCPACSPAPPAAAGPSARPRRRRQAGSCRTPASPACNPPRAPTVKPATTTTCLPAAVISTPSGAWSLNPPAVKPAHHPSRSTAPQAAPATAGKAVRPAALCPGPLLGAAAVPLGWRRRRPRGAACAAAPPTVTALALTGRSRWRQSALRRCSPGRPRMRPSAKAAAAAQVWLLLPPRPPPAARRLRMCRAPWIFSRTMHRHQAAVSAGLPRLTASAQPRTTTMTARAPRRPTPSTPTTPASSRCSSRLCQRRRHQPAPPLRRRRRRPPRPRPLLRPRPRRASTWASGRTA